MGKEDSRANMLEILKQKNVDKEKLKNIEIPKEIEKPIINKEKPKEDEKPLANQEKAKDIEITKEIEKPEVISEKPTNDKPKEDESANEAKKGNRKKRDFVEITDFDDFFENNLMFDYSGHPYLDSGLTELIQTISKAQDIKSYQLLNNIVADWKAKNIKEIQKILNQRNKRLGL